MRSITQPKVEYSSRIWVATLSREKSWFLMLKSAHAPMSRSEPSGMLTNTISRRKKHAPGFSALWIRDSATAFQKSGK
jgi:hypothetical protein